MFDYDDLPDEPSDFMTDLARRLHYEVADLESYLSVLHPMTDNEMHDFSLRLERAEQAKNYFDFEVAIGEALIKQETFKARMPHIITAFLSRLANMAKRPSPELEAAVALMYNLWQLSLSTSLHEVRTRPSNVPDVPCVLILGCAGSGVDDLEEQAKWYQDRGFATISTTAVAVPKVLFLAQFRSLASELRATLGQEGKLVLHICSHWGVSFASRILQIWTAGVAPFDDLPPLVECLKAIVFECALAPSVDPATNSISHPTKDYMAPLSASTKSQDFDVDASSEDETPADKAHTMLYSMAIIGCVEALTKRWDTTPLKTLISKHNIIRKFVRVVARMMSPTKGFVTSWRSSGSSALSEPEFSFEALDRSMKMPVPRLFLYSEMDPVVPPERVEACMAHMARYHPTAEILSAKLKNQPTARFGRPSQRKVLRRSPRS
mmetsp:Transcript_96133/g.206242  ORF Transcript_96133/g.206242 Transcript_96133/m.206242 type:complete len:436 (-) Transcript_96133:134-1441(-)